MRVPSCSDGGRFLFRLRPIQTSLVVVLAPLPVGVGGLGMVDDKTLQKHARNAIQAGDLPSRLPDKVWAGSGTTGRCAVCGEPIVDGVEFEMVFTDEWHAVQQSCCVHRGC